MKHIHIILIGLMASVILGLYSQTNVTSSITTFRDLSDSTRILVWQEDPEYPFLTPPEYRWLIMAYLTEDDIINPLNEKGEPTGDDIVNPYVSNIPERGIGQVSSGLRFGPDIAGAALILGGGVVVTPDNFGKKLYLRIFNAPKLEDATKYMVFKFPLRVIEAGPKLVNIYPYLPWDTDPVWKWISEPKPEHPCEGCDGSGCD